MVEAEVIKSQGCKVGRVGFCKEGGDGGELVVHIVSIVRFLDFARKKSQGKVENKCKKKQRFLDFASSNRKLFLLF